MRQRWAAIANFSPQTKSAVDSMPLNSLLPQGRGVQTPAMMQQIVLKLPQGSVSRRFYEDVLEIAERVTSGSEASQHQMVTPVMVEEIASRHSSTENDKNMVRSTPFHDQIAYSDTVE